MKQVNILMMGGKRCGKTTVLASMYGEINKALAGTNLRLEVETPQTEQELIKARYSIQRKMDDFKTPLTRVEVDDNPTSALKTYSFRLVVEGGSKIPFKIHDIPGEWLTDSHQKEVRNLVKDCQVIIIAIDTPYLFSKMTSKGYGIYHEEYNKPMEIANFFKNSLSVENIEDRMILFVPIKCERYYHLTNTPQLNTCKRNYMQELIDAIGCGYRDLLMYLRSTAALVNNCTMAITPILSAGGIDFVRFRTDQIRDFQPCPIYRFCRSHRHSVTGTSGIRTPFRHTFLHRTSHRNRLRKRCRRIIQIYHTFYRLSAVQLLSDLPILQHIICILSPFRTFYILYIIPFYTLFHISICFIYHTVL